MRILAVSGGKAWIIDQESVSCERQITPSNGVASAAISPDGLRCVTWSLKSAEVEVWDVNDGRRAVTLGAGPSPCLGFSPDGRWLITGSAEEYMFWETRSWARRKTIQRGVTGGAHGKIAFTSDSRLVALAVGRGEVALFDALDLEALATLEGTEVSAVTSLSFSCDGTRLAVGTTHPSIQYWNLRLVREGLAELNLDYPRPWLPAQRVSPGAMGGPSVAGDWPSQAGLGGHDVRSAPDSRVR
jgi:WD40 repeat protein